MLSNNGQFHFEDVEIGVDEPGGYARGSSKYDAPTKIVKESPPDQWHRMRIADKKSGTLLNGHLKKRFPRGTHTGRIREIDGEVWYYWRWTEEAAATKTK